MTINPTDARIKSLQRQLAIANKKITHLNQELDAIHISEGWHILQKLYLIRDILFPANIGPHKLLHKLKKSFLLRNHDEVAILNQTEPTKIYKEKFPEHHTGYNIKISIVTPSFNQGDYIEDTIKSVVNQKYTQLEYFIQDANSSDTTPSILAKYRKKIKYSIRADKGQTNAINIAFKKTSGEIMAYINSDDVYCEGVFQYVNWYFQTHPEVDVIYGNRIIINHNNRQIGRWILPPYNEKVIKIFDYIPQETMFWRRSIWQKIGGQLDESFDFAMDWDLIIRFVKAGAVIRHVPYFMAMFRVHGEQKTSSKQITVGQKECQRIRKRIHHRQPSQEEINESLQKYRHQGSIRSLLFDLGIRV